MKPTIILLALTSLILGSCSTAYKTGQTPDDVYYSPARPGAEYVAVEKQDDRYYSGSDYYEDRYLRMRVQNRSRWAELDDYYFYNTYAYNPYGYYNNWSNPWNSYWAWNSYYNPYSGGGIIIKNPSAYNPPSKPIAFNPASYGGGTGARGYTGYRPGYVSPGGARYNNSNRPNTVTGGRSSNSNSLGGSIRKVFSGTTSNNNGSNNNNSTPTRSYNPSSSSNSSSSGRSSGGGSVSRPNR